MSISRKDFIRQSLRSLGEAVCSVSDALKQPAAPSVNLPDVTNFVAEPRENEVAVAHNDSCLARSSGCFSCVERCEPGAIKLIPGVGIRVNPQICTGCGMCEYVCPVTPKAIRMQVRSTTHITPSAYHAELPPQKGE